MNWRLLTAINAAIALVTVSAVIFGISRTRSQRPGNVRRQNVAAAQPNLETAKFDDKAARSRVEALTDLSNARVDDLGAVAAAELTHLMDRATPEQLAALALKFNDAPTDARTFGGMAIFFQAWTQLDPKSALSGAFQLNDVTMRKLAATAVVNSTSPSAAPELIARLTQNPDKDLSFECKNEFLDPLIAHWSTVDPEAASKFMDQLGDTKSSLNTTARENIAYNWGTLDPAAALEWARKQTDKDYLDSGRLYDQAIQGWCLANLPEAAAYVGQHLDDDAAPAAASSVAAAMFSHDPQQATEWMRNMPEGRPKSAAESTIVQTWAEKDPSASAKWLATLTEDEQKDLVGTIVRIWGQHDWSETSRWMSSLTGDVRDYAISNAMNRPDTTEDDSLRLALTIQNETLRRNRIEETIHTWSYNDPDAAEAWVRTSALPLEQQSELLSTISEVRKANHPALEEVITDQ